MSYVSMYILDVFIIYIQLYTFIYLYVCYVIHEYIYRLK